MAIKLSKPVAREMLSQGLERGKHRSRSIIATLLPGDTLEFRAKGTRQRWEVYLGHAFRLAQIVTLYKEYKQKCEEYARRKKAGERVRRPKRPMLPFGKIYFAATKND